MRLPEGPWYRAARDAWYVKIDGQQHLLGKHPPAAPKPKKGKLGWNAPREIQDAYHRLRVLGPSGLPKSQEITVAHVCDLFLTFICPYVEPPKKQPKANDPQPPLKPNATHEVRTYWWYRSFLDSFCGHKKVGVLPAAQLKVFHVTQWLAAHPGWVGGRRPAVICVKRAFNWATGEGLLKENPLRGLKKPPASRRERILTAEEWEQLFAAVVDQEFKDFLLALRETGARPGEIRRVTADDVNLELGVWVLEHHKTRKKTGLPRVVYLTPVMLELCKRLCERWPTGPIFRGPKRKGHKPYSRNAIRCRFRRLRIKLPQLKGVISYTLRHTWITDALERKVPVATVAELAGHKDLKMIQAHYSHLSEKRKHLQEAARQATGCAEEPEAPPAA
jgi:site-specific recombinase XerD